MAAREIALDAFSRKKPFNVQRSTFNFLRSMLDVERWTFASLFQLL
jgi:hypothetical protein